ncbi:MAG: bifunctional riboflavin kinase/FAD synthetase [Flavisolibacter sp.]
MQVHYSIDQLPSFPNAVITIGTFDGVHTGHRKIIDALVNEAVHVNGESIIITFHPHPRKVVNPQEPLQLLNTLEEKISLLKDTDVDHLVIVPFTPEFASLDADQYIRDFLVSRFNPHTIIIGYDHHFGKGRQGNFAMLSAKANTYNYRLQEIPKYLLDEIAVSSTKIRQAILSSEIENANRLLGYSFFFDGIVIHGDKLGRQLGYPTANLHNPDPDKIALGYGVYAVLVEFDGIYKKGMLSIGNRPTLEGSDERVEVNIFDWDQEIYGASIKVIVQHFLRGQVKYESLEAMKEQLAKDREESLAALGEEKANGH